MKPSSSISPFPLMLINSAEKSWIPFHLWNDAFINSYRASRVISIGSLYDVPAYYKERFHNSPDYKGRWIYTNEENGPPLMWGELHRFSFGFQYDILFIQKIEDFPDMAAAITLLISGVILSSGTDLLRVFPYSSNLSPENLKEIKFFELGSKIEVSHLSRKVINSSRERPLKLIQKQGIEIIPKDWWESEIGSKHRGPLKYIEINRRNLTEKELEKKKKPARSPRGILSRLFFPRINR